MQKNTHAIHKDIASLVFYMQGSLDFNDAYCLSISQRQMMVKIIETDRENRSGKPNSRLI